MWCFPGGKVKIKEDYLTATEREIQEETGQKFYIFKSINYKRLF
jgi:ADP-ribose pyrophosphatase YjhB (NUDIX family)